MPHGSIWLCEGISLYSPQLKDKVMKAYQVHKGELDKHGRQCYDLVATYFDKVRALQHAEQIAESTPLYGDKLEFDGWYGDGKYASWSAVGWERVCVAQMEEIEITE